MQAMGRCSKPEVTPGGRAKAMGFPVRWFLTLSASAACRWSFRRFSENKGGGIACDGMREDRKPVIACAIIAI